jgi:hypothetical protein
VKNDQTTNPEFAVKVPVAVALGMESTESAACPSVVLTCACSATAEERRASGRIPLVISLADTLVATAPTSTYTVDSQRYNFDVSDARNSRPATPVAGKLEVVA